jgi:predicted nuclease of predicted toxin-antitoxin system
VKLLFDESLSPRLVERLSQLFPESESALRNGLARQGDMRILEYAVRGDFVLITTDADFRGLMAEAPEARVVILKECDYPTRVAEEVLRRNAIRIAELRAGLGRLLVLDR